MTTKDCQCIGCEHYEGDHPEFGYVLCSIDGGRSKERGSGCSRFAPDITATCHSSMGRCRHDNDGVCDMQLRSRFDQKTHCRGYVARGYFKQSESNKGCFISTAACMSSGLPDDCSELTYLRQMRDAYLAHSPTGRAMIASYYRWAPEVVELIDRSPQREAVYLEVMARIADMPASASVDDFVAAYLEMVRWVCAQIGFDVRRFLPGSNPCMLDPA